MIHDKFIVIQNVDQLEVEIEYEGSEFEDEDEDMTDQCENYAASDVDMEDEELNEKTFQVNIDPQVKAKRILVLLLVILHYPGDFKEQTGTSSFQRTLTFKGVLLVSNSSGCVW